MMMILNWVTSLVALVCFIMVLIKIFQDKAGNGIVHGIIGIVTCSLWAFIWGWISSGRLAVRNLMIIWTIAIVVNMVTGGAAVAEMMQKLKGG